MLLAHCAVLYVYCVSFLPRLYGKTRYYIVLGQTWHGHTLGHSGIHMLGECVRGGGGDKVVGMQLYIYTELSACVCGRDLKILKVTACMPLTTQT